MLQQRLKLVSVDCVSLGPLTVVPTAASDLLLGIRAVQDNLAEPPDNPAGSKDKVRDIRPVARETSDTGSRRPDIRAVPRDNPAAPRDNQAAPRDNPAEPRDIQAGHPGNQAEPMGNQVVNPDIPAEGLQGRSGGSRRLGSQVGAGSRLGRPGLAAVGREGGRLRWGSLDCTDCTCRRMCKSC
jgi:hypothetical protein